MLNAQVVNHSSHLSPIGDAFVGHCTEVKFLLDGLKATISLTNEVCASIFVSDYLSLI